MSNRNFRGIPYYIKGTHAPMMRTRARMQIVASDRARRGNVPEYIHFTERPKKPLAAGSVGVRVGSFLY